MRCFFIFLSAPTWPLRKKTSVYIWIIRAKVSLAADLSSYRRTDFSSFVRFYLAKIAPCPPADWRTCRIADLPLRDSSSRILPQKKKGRVLTRSPRQQQNQTGFQAARRGRGSLRSLLAEREIEACCSVRSVCGHHAALRLNTTRGITPPTYAGRRRGSIAPLPAQ